MLILGIICLVLGFVLSIPILWTIGIILCVIGVVLLTRLVPHGHPAHPAPPRSTQWPLPTRHSTTP